MFNFYLKWNTTSNKKTLGGIIMNLVQGKMANRGWIIEDSEDTIVTAEKQHSETIVGVFECDSKYAKYQAFDVNKPEETLVFLMKPYKEDEVDIMAEQLYFKADTTLTVKCVIAQNNILSKTLQALTC